MGGGVVVVVIVVVAVVAVDVVLAIVSVDVVVALGIVVAAAVIIGIIIVVSERDKTDMPFVLAFPAHAALEVPKISVWPMISCAMPFVLVLFDVNERRPICRLHWYL